MCCYFVLLTLLPGTFRSLAQHLRRAIKANTHWVTVITAVHGESGITDGGDEPEGGEEETPEVDEEEDDDEEEAEEDDDEGDEEEEEVAQPQQKRPAAAVPMVANVLFNI